MFQYLDFRAIGLGVLTNLLLAFALGVFASVVAITVLSALGFDEDAIERLMDKPWESLPLYGFFVVAGAASDFGAATVTSKVATRLEYYQTFAMMLCMILVSLSFGAGQIPVPYFLISILAGLVAAFYGARRIKIIKTSHRP